MPGVITVIDHKSASYKHFVFITVQKHHIRRDSFETLFLLNGQARPFIVPYFNLFIVIN